MQYQIFELTPRGVLGGLKVKPAGTPNLTVLVEPGVFNVKGGVDLLEVKTTQTIDLTAKVPGVGADPVVVPIYANIKADGTAEIALTPEADKAPGYVRFGQHDEADDHTKGRSLKIAEVTLANGQTAINEQHISVKCRFQFDQMRTKLNGLHNDRTNANDSFGF